ncbi:MAG TPA: threonine/serine dehydratase [Alphaproteobacteria bacterium]
MRNGLPDIEDVVDAARRLRGKAVVTPLLRAPALDRIAGGTLLIKAEPLQRTGSFKFRGAYNRISRIPEEERSRGVVSWSSGNHAQGVAAAAGLLGIPATIVMPSDAPAPKLDNTRALGAEVVLYDRYAESREDIGTRIAEQRGATIIKPYDDPWIIAGQGTVGLEAAGQALAAGLSPDHALVACSGGGLVSGTAIALTDHLPGITVHSVEPEGFDDTARSLAAGARLANDPAARSICDALLAPTPGELTFEINRRLLGPGIVVSDADARAAMRAAFRHLRLVAEPGGALPLAAALSGRFDCRGKCVLVVVSGGNVAPELFAETLLAGEDPGG